MNKENVLEGLYILYCESRNLELKKEIELLNKIDEIKAIVNISNEEFNSYVDNIEGELV